MNLISRICQNSTTNLFDWLKNKQNVAALSIAFVVLLLHLFSINRIENKTVDENFYTATANLVIYTYDGDVLYQQWPGIYESPEEAVEYYRDQLFYEHTPLGVLFIAAGIEIFGDEPLGWRIFPVLFGFVSILLFYSICRELIQRAWVPVIMTFIYAFENLNFIMSGVAMLDVFSVTFMLGGFLLYLRGKYALSGLLLAMSMLAKITGALGIAIIVGHWFLVRREKKKEAVWFLSTVILGFLILLPVLEYVAVHDLVYPWDTLNYMFTYHSHETFSSYSPDYLSTRQVSRPWEWIILQTDSGTSEIPYRVYMSWSLSVFIIPIMAYMIWRIINTKRKWEPHDLFIFLWFFGVFFSWLMIYLIWDRLMYDFYLYPAVGAVCIAMGYVILQLWLCALSRSNRIARWAIQGSLALWLTGHFAVFWVMNPMAW